ncbi:MAG: hypothetical protein HRT35_07130, partial [Algicola sp.]|nr:hypothetical protein [Algicola sp.]
MSRILTYCSLLLVLIFGLNGFADATTSGGMRIKGPKNTDHGVLGHRYGPLRSSDTLWRIAAKIRDDDSVSIYKVMYALYKKNPGSFLDQNYNNLKNDTYLKIPTLREIKRVNLNDARTKAELDDKLWAAKQRGELTPAKIESAKNQIKNVKQSDLVQAKTEIKSEIVKLQNEQAKLFVELKEKMAQSTIEMSVEREINLNQQQRLDRIVLSIAAMAEQSKQDQAEMLAALQALAEEERERANKREEEEKGFDLAALWQELVDNPTYLIVSSFMLTTIVILFFWLMMRRKKRKAEAKEEDSLFETPAPAPAPAARAPAPAAAIDDSLLPEDITDDNFSLDDVDESLTTLDDDLLAPEEDDAIHLDDTMP